MLCVDFTTLIKYFYRTFLRLTAQRYCYISKDNYIMPWLRLIVVFS